MSSPTLGTVPRNRGLSIGVLTWHHAVVMLAAQVNRGESLVWLIGAMVCLLAAPWVQLSVSTGNEDDHIMRCRPVSHFRDCKVLLVTSLTHVSGTIASVQTFTFFTLSASFQKNCPPRGSVRVRTLPRGRRG